MAALLPVALVSHAPHSTWTSWCGLSCSSVLGTWSPHHKVLSGQGLGPTLVLTLAHAVLPQTKGRRQGMQNGHTGQQQRHLRVRTQAQALQGEICSSNCMQSLASFHFKQVHMRTHGGS